MGARAGGGSDGTAIRDCHGGKPKLVRVRWRRWSDYTEAVFLDHLSLTCNVTASAEAAGVCTTGAYARRRRLAGFAERWREALEIGYERLEARLIENAERSFSGEATDALAGPPMTVAEAIHLLRHHQNSKEIGARRGSHPYRVPKLDEVRASIVRKLEAIERARARS